MAVAPVGAEAAGGKLRGVRKRVKKNLFLTPVLWSMYPALELLFPPSGYPLLTLLAGGG